MNVNGIADPNRTARAYSRERRIEELIASWAASDPERIALVSDACELTFGRLDRLANKLAHYLRSAGAGRGSYVMVCLERDELLLIAIVAVLKAGAAFIPVDPEEPPARIAHLAKLPEVSMVVTAPAFASLFSGSGLHSVLLDRRKLEESDISEEPLPPIGDSRDPAYGIATSGSSGVPKTVIVAHHAVINLIEWIADEFQVGPDDRGLWVSPVSFDLSIFDLLGLPALGASVRAVARAQRRDPIACAEMLLRERITFWNSTPALLDTLIPFLRGSDAPLGARSHLRMAFLSGDWIPLGQPDQLRAIFPRLEVISLGGATEATVWSNSYRIGDVDPAWTSIPYGRPMQNARYYVLDEKLAPCDVDVPGELYIAGDCLALGYLGDPELTGARFVPDPFAEHPGHGDARMYRTGDGARIWADGIIELLGRLDNQINVRGYRVDLGEVEAALKRCGVAHAVAVSVDGASASQRIVAAGVRGASEVSAATIRRELARYLPSHMIPDEVRLLDELPLTANGKADRKAIARWAEQGGTPREARAQADTAGKGRLGAAEVAAFLRAEIKKLRGDAFDTVPDDCPLGDAGLGSLEFAILSGRLFEALGIKVNPVEFYRGATLGTVAKLVSEMAPASAVAQEPQEPQEPDDEAPRAPVALDGEQGGEQDGAPRVAIVGMSCRVPGAGNLDAFWDVIRSGRDCLTPISPERARLSGTEGDGAGIRAGFIDDVTAFDARFFGITPREAETMDPRHRILLEAVWTAIEHAGDDPATIAGSRTGVFIGATGDDFSRIVHRDPANVVAHTLTGISPSLLANRISFVFDLRGPSETVDTACSSSLVALHRALGAIAAGDCDAAIVGGVSVMLDAATHLSLQRIGMLSPDGACRSFDAGANGYARGEGVAVIYLKKYANAELEGHRIYGVVLGTAVNHGGRGVSLTAPSPEAQKRVLVDAYRRAGIDPRTVGMIEAHGTGTALGDPIETRALVDAFYTLYEERGLEPCREPHCALNAVKSNIGHLEAAAGMVGLVKAVLAARHGVIPPIAHLASVNEHIALDGSPLFIAAKGGPWPVATKEHGRRVGVSSFGFGGANVHVVLECAPEPPPKRAHALSSPVAIVVSARDAEALRGYVRAYADYLDALAGEGHGDGVLADVAFTSYAGRHAYGQRAAVVADGLNDARRAFRALSDPSLSDPSVNGGVWGAERAPRPMADALQTWVSGGAVDLGAVIASERDRAWRRVAIPTYPFARIRYWPLAIQEPARQEPARQEPVRAVPAAPGEGYCDLSLASSAPLIAAHRIGGGVAIPASVFIRLMERMSRELLGDGVVRLERIRFLGNMRESVTPATLSAAWQHAGGALQLSLRPTAQGPLFCRAQAVIVSNDAQDANGVDPAHALPTVPAARSRLDREGIYDLFAKRGIAFGASLRTLRNAAWSDQHCEAELSTDADVPEPELALLDGAFQVALLWQLETAPPDGLPIPFSIESLTVYRALPPECSVVVTAMTEGTGSPRTTALTIADAQGRICLRVSGFTALIHRPKQPPACLFAKRAVEVRPANRAGAPRAQGPRPSACVFGSDELLRALGARIDVCKPSLDGTIVRGAAPFAVIVEMGREGWEAELQRASNIAKSLMQQAAVSEPIRLVWVRLVSPERSPDALALGSALGSFSRSLRLEDPRLHVSAVDCRVAAGGGWSEPGLAGALAHLVRSEDVAPEIAIDAATGRITSLQIAPIRPLTAPAPYREQGVYLITGGLGGIGRLIAADLAARFHARVVVCGRSPLDARAEALLGELRGSRGEGEGEGEIVYLPADVADRAAVRALLDAIRARFGRIDGIFHGAGVLRDGLLAYAGPGDRREVVRPKALGAHVLDIETRGDALDFFVLFSSLVATTGNAGQSAYAFANGWLEGFARAREAERRGGRRQGITVAVGFGPWRSQGMKLPAAAEKRLAERHGLAVFDASGGTMALQRAIATGEPNVIVAAGDAVRLGEWLGIGSDKIGADRIESEKSESERIESETGEPPMPNQDLRARAMDLIVSAIAQEAKLQPNEIDRSARFEDYGIDSMMIMSLTERLEESLGALPKTLFFEHRTVAELADYLARAHAASLADKTPAEKTPSPAPAIPAPKAAIPAPKAQMNVSSPPIPAQSEKMSISKADEDIAIIGVHGRFAEADDLDEFWENLKTGRDCISEVPPERWDHHLVVPPEDASVGLSSGFRWGGFLRDAFAFDPRFFKMSKREAEMIDPQERLFLMSAYHCLEDAGYPGATLAGAEVGVFAGVMWGQYEMWGLERGNAASSYGSVAHRVSYQFDWRGPSMAVDSMCSSSLTAIHLACASLRSGESAYAIAGGVNVNAHPNKHLFLCKRRFAASDGRCHAFGDGGDGYVAGEGVGTLLLKLRSAAERDGDRILGLIRATAVNHDGRTNGYTVPNPAAQTSVVRAALSRAGIDPGTIGYIEAHGTGTPLGDPIEVSALANAFQSESAPHGTCAIGAVKSNIGHAESAAGIAGVIKVLLQMRHRQLVPSIHADPPNPHIAFDTTPFRVQRELAPWPAKPNVRRRAGVSSFGAGGANAHVILEEWIPSATTASSTLLPRDEAHLIPLSAQTDDRLLESMRRLRTALERHAHAASADGVEASSPEASAGKVPAAASALSTVLELVAETLGLDRRFVASDDRFEDYGVSPATGAELAGRLSGAFGIALDDAGLHEGSIADLAARVDALRRGGGGAQVLDLGDIAYTLQTGREPLSSRAAFVASSVDELIELLNKAIAGQEDARIVRGRVTGPASSRASSEAQKNFAANLIRHRRLPRLGDLWCQGAEIEWPSLHHPGSRQRLTLPGYPFAKEHCFVPDPTVLVRGRAGALHPLVDAVDIPRSVEGGLTFRKAISRHSTPALGGALAVAVAHAAAGLASEAGSHRLTHVRWAAARPFASDVQDLRIRTARGQNGALDIEVSLADGADAFLTATAHTEAGEGHRGTNGVSKAGAAAVNGVAAASEWTEDFSGEDVKAPGAEGHWTAPLVDRVLRAALRTDGADATKAARVEEVIFRGAPPSRGRITVKKANHALHASVLADDGSVRFELRGLAIEPHDSAARPQSVTPERTAAPVPVPASAPEPAPAPVKEAAPALVKEAAPEPPAVRERIAPPEPTVAPAKIVTPERVPAKARAITRPLARRIDWVEVPLTQAAAVDETDDGPATDDARVVMCSETEHALRDALLHQLGAVRTHEIALDDALTEDEWAAALDRISDISEIFLLLGGGPPVIDPAALASAESRALRPLLWLAKKLDKWRAHDPRPALRVITLGAHRVADEPVNPISSAAAAVVSAMAREAHRSDITCVDLSASLDESALEEAVHQALPILRQPTPARPVLTLRNGRALRRVLHPLPLPLEPLPHSVFDHGERILMVGGSGTVGRRLSEALVRDLGAHVAWIGRRPEDETIADATQRIESLGGRLTYMTADVTKPGELRAALDRIWRHVGPFRTVFHCGMEFTLARLQATTEQTFEANLAAKVKGSMTLLKVLEEYPVERVVFMSSAEAFVGNAGWAAYSAACAFQDGLAHTFSGRAASRILSLNWGYWESASRGRAETLVAKGVTPISSDIALDVLEQALSTDLRQIAALDVEPHVLERMGLLDESATPIAPAADTAATEADSVALSALAASSEESSEPSSEASEPTEAAAAPPAAPVVDVAAAAPTPRAAAKPMADESARRSFLRDRTTIEARLKDLMGGVLRIEPTELDPAVDLVDYGVDSILMVDFFELVEKSFGKMPLEELIELHTLGAMSEYIHHRAEASLIELPAAEVEAAPEAPAAEVEAAPEASNEAPPAIEAAPEAAPEPPIPEPIDEPPPGVVVVESAPAEDATAVLKGYPQRMDPRTGSLLLPLAGHTGPKIEFWMVGRTPETAVEVVHCGRGPAVVLITGIGLTAPIFHRQFEALWRNWSVYAVHAPAHGRSKAPKNATTKALSETIAQTIEQLDLGRPVHMVASCFGTVAAQHVASHRPELVASLTLCGAFSEELTVPPIPAEGLTAKDVAALTQAAQQSLANDFNSLLELPANVDHQEAITSARDLLLASQVANPAVGMRYLNEVLTLTPASWSAAISAPTLFVVGTHDTVIPPSASDKGAARMPDARVHRIENAGHYPFLTHSDAFTTALLEFIEKVERTRSQPAAAPNSEAAVPAPAAPARKPVIVEQEHALGQ